MVFVDAGKFVIFIIEGKSHDAGILRRSYLLDAILHLLILKKIKKLDCSKLEQCTLLVLY